MPFMITWCQILPNTERLFLDDAHMGKKRPFTEVREQPGIQRGLCVVVYQRICAEGAETVLSILPPDVI